MDTVGKQQLMSFFAGSQSAEIASNSESRRDSGHPVRSYLELATKIAELQFLNRDYVLLFRGQGADYRNSQGATTLRPSLFRPVGPDSSKVPKQHVLEKRYEQLAIAEETLVSLYEKEKLLGIQRLRRQHILRWSILQHYQVCTTPLLDVTHSLRIAASFASLAGGAAGFIYVLGVPNLSGAITANTESGIQVVRLSSACPPSALRPHLQEGYLLAEYPDMMNSLQKAHYQFYEIDFGRRLIAKFRFDPKRFWQKSSTFPQVAKSALYPSTTRDPIQKLTLKVTKALDGIK